MQAIHITPVESKKDLKSFIHFNYDLYKNNEYAVPELSLDLMNTFSKKEECSLGVLRIPTVLGKKRGKGSGAHCCHHKP